MIERQNLVSPIEKSNLHEKIKPIRVSLMAPFEDDFVDPKTGEHVFYSNQDIENFSNEFKRREKVQNVLWGDGLGGLEEANFLHGGEQTYVISPISESDKFSEGYNTCTGLLVSGIDKVTGKNISFLTHQYSDLILRVPSIRDMFRTHLNRVLVEMKERCIKDSVDAVVFGGDYSEDMNSDAYPSITMRYQKTLEVVGDEFKKYFDIEPVVINGPKLESRVYTSHVQDGKEYMKYEFTTDDAYFDNKDRRLYLVRSKINQPGEGRTSGDFKISDLEDRKRDWGL